MFIDNFGCFFYEHDGLCKAAFFSIDTHLICFIIVQNWQMVNRQKNSKKL